MTNTKLLSGMGCPECRSYEPFLIEATTMLTVFDSGESSTQKSEWNDFSFCQCLECGEEGTVADFTVTSAEATQADTAAA